MSDGPAPDALRPALGRFATGVVIVTAPRAGGGWAAVTVNSFTSVSLDPPLVLWCLSRKSNCLAHFERASRFTINVLRHDQQGLSNNFARPSNSSWTDVPSRPTPEGDLLLEGAIATFQCREHARHVEGDHVIFIGRIERHGAGPPARPLAFFQGRYGSFTADQSGYAPPSLDPGVGGEITLGWG